MNPYHRCRLRGFLTRFGALLLGVVVVFFQGRAAWTAPAAAQTTSSALLINAGWYGDYLPTARFVATNKAFLEATPFSGLVVHLLNESTGANPTQTVMSKTPVSYETIAASLAPIAGMAFTNLRHNFGLIQGWTPPDFFDDWTVTVQNYANLARALKNAGLKGFFFDNEQYGNKWGRYPYGVKYPSRSLAEYQIQARLRGKQVMQAMIVQFPGIEVVTMHGPTVSEPKVPEPLFPVWYTHNHLLGPYFAGHTEGLSGSALNIDGGEFYRLRAASEFLASYNWRKYTHPSDAINCPFIIPSIRPTWPSKTSISFGVYDCTWGNFTMSPTILRTTLTHALRQADRYVWLYTEDNNFLVPASKGGASAGWIDAVRQARNDAGSGSGPAAPQNLSVSPASSSAIDLSWWDMSSNETGFEVERKTGTSGTWSRVLTTTSNVNAMDDIGLGAGTTYVYRVRAMNLSGVSAWSNEAGTTTSGSQQGPSPPSHLSVRSTAASTIGIAWWDMSSNETGFEVQRKTGVTGTWSRITTTGPNTSSYDNTGLPASTSYVYRVRAVNGSASSAWSNEIGASTTAGGPGPSAPSHLSVQAVSSSSLRVSWWDMSSNESGFEVERKTGASGTWTRVWTSGDNVSVYTNSGLSSGVPYTYRVRSVNSSGASSWSAEAGATTP